MLICELISCKLQPTSDRLAAENAGARAFRLRLAPAPGSTYSYYLSSRSEYNFEANGNKLNNLSKVDASIDYIIDRDSRGNFGFRVKFDKIHIYSKNGEAVSDLDAASAASATDPVERLLGNLKDANIVVTLSPAGEVKSVSGFQEMYDEYMAQFGAGAAYQMATVKQTWQGKIGDEFIHNNMGQLFRIFPDSAVHIGDKWQLNSKQKDEIGLNLANLFTLTDIHDQTAFIESEGAITSDSLSIFMGTNVIANLKGQQKGAFQVETKTGMLVRGKITTTVKGTLQIMGREIPVTIESSLKMVRR